MSVTGQGTEREGFSWHGSVNAPPLKLQNRFEELNIYDTSEQVATGSTHVTTIEGVSSIKKHSVVNQTACLIPHSKLFKTI